MTYTWAERFKRGQALGFGSARGEEDVELSLGVTGYGWNSPSITIGGSAGRLA
ncbi:MAG TPA: hypothetical protein VGA88_03105 [Burkholderiales bacterium]